jgi:CubicO group peptidase (beta-lactamase class C family)
MEHSSFIDDYDEEQMAAVAQTDREEFGRDYFSVKGVEYGCGDILTTPQDMYLWYRGLTGGEVIGKEAYALMTADYSDPNEPGYGYGLSVSDESGFKVLYHYGYIPSYYSACVYIPEYDYFQLVTGNHADGYPHMLAADMAEYFCSVIGIELPELD